MDKRLQVVTREATFQQQFTRPLVKIPPLPECEICVIVPVRNEAQTLHNTLKALASQTDLHGRRFHPKRYEIILLANNCSDDSVALARVLNNQPGNGSDVLIWSVDELDGLLTRGCDWLKDYLNTQPQVRERLKVCRGKNAHFSIRTFQTKK